MPISNSELAAKLDDTATGWRGFVEEQIKWLTAEVPTVELTDPYDSSVSVTVKTPWQLQQDYDALLEPGTGAIAQATELLEDAQELLASTTGTVATATTAATNAANSATAAAASATAAQGFRDGAQTYANNASSSATAASTSATNASNSATTAGTQASNASASASAASTSATNAANSASAAAASAATAQTGLTVQSSPVRIQALSFATTNNLIDMSVAGAGTSRTVTYTLNQAVLDAHIRDSAFEHDTAVTFDSFIGSGTGLLSAVSGYNAPTKGASVPGRHGIVVVASAGTTGGQAIAQDVGYFGGAQGYRFDITFKPVWTGSSAGACTVGFSSLTTGNLADGNGMYLRLRKESGVVYATFVSRNGGASESAEDIEGITFEADGFITVTFSVQSNRSAVTILAGENYEFEAFDSANFPPAGPYSLYVHCNGVSGNTTTAFVDHVTIRHY